ncbi:type IV pilin protein [Acinetobacter sp. CAAS 2-6]|uniref:type IV pilin protein n=1 Tax=Acinetobacter sp. CAAS 2-6 TaxID=3016358 RepID=UPI002DD643D1|nr:type IV pilin protein [Acinetobacter sp. CAAS 2-6]
MQKNKGFTLIELMITVLIVVILAGIAMPMYSNYITKSKARNAGADLVALSLLVENLYQRNLTYPVPTPNPTTSTAETQTYAAGWQPTESQTFAYTANVDATNKQYTLTATGISNTRNAGCVLTLTNANVRSVNTSSGCGGLTSW